MSTTELGPDVRIHFDATDGCWLVAPEPGLGPFVAGPAGYVVHVPMDGVRLGADIANPTWLVEGRFEIGTAPVDPAGVALAERLWGTAVARVLVDDDRSIEHVVPLDPARQRVRAAAAALVHYVSARPADHDAPSPWALVVGALAGAVGLDAYAESQRSLGRSWLAGQREQLSRAVHAAGGVQAAALAALARRLCGVAPDSGLEALADVIDQAAERVANIDDIVAAEAASALAGGDNLALVLRGWAADRRLALASRHGGEHARVAPGWLRRDVLSPATLAVPVGVLAGPVELSWDEDSRTLTARAELAPSLRPPPALWLRAYQAATAVVVAGQRCTVADNRLLAHVRLSEAMTATPLDVEVSADSTTGPLLGRDAVFREATNNAALATRLEAHARHRAAVLAYRRAARRFHDAGHDGLAFLAHRCAERAGRRGATAGAEEASRLASDADADRDDADRLAGEEPWAFEAGRSLTPVLEPLLPDLLDGLFGITRAEPGR